MRGGCGACSCGGVVAGVPGGGVAGGGLLLSRWLGLARRELCPSGEGPDNENRGEAGAAESNVSHKTPVHELPYLLNRDRPFRCHGRPIAGEHLTSYDGCAGYSPLVKTS